MLGLSAPVRCGTFFASWARYVNWKCQTPHGACNTGSKDKKETRPIGWEPPKMQSSAIGPGKYNVFFLLKFTGINISTLLSLWCSTRKEVLIAYKAIAVTPEEHPIWIEDVFLGLCPPSFPPLLPIPWPAVYNMPLATFAMYHTHKALNSCSIAQTQWFRGGTITNCKETLHGLKWYRKSRLFCLA